MLGKTTAIPDRDALERVLALGILFVAGSPILAGQGDYHFQVVRYEDISYKAFQRNEYFDRARYE
jgi:hypothetical protein